MHGDIVNMMKGNTNKVLQKHGADSFSGIFWLQQINSVKYKAKKDGGSDQGVSILTVPSKVYETICHSGVINKSPSSRTL